MTEPEQEQTLKRKFLVHQREKALDTRGVLVSDPQPASVQDQIGSCSLSRGTLKWSIKPVRGRNGLSARVEILFIPRADRPSDGTITFIQTVGEEALVPVDSDFNLKQNFPDRVDAKDTETDPFYGAKWKSGRWGSEEGNFGHPRVSGVDTVAQLLDTPMVPWAQYKRFESAAVIPETGEVLGALRWGLLCSDNPSNGRVLIGGPTGLHTERLLPGLCIATVPECSEQVSYNFDSTVEKFYSGKSNLSVLNGFASGQTDLSPRHREQLDKLLIRLATVPVPDRRILIGGAATMDEGGGQDAVNVSRRRAESVKRYFTAHFVDASMIDVEAYGAAWAQVPISRSDSGPLNRRVYVWV